MYDSYRYASVTCAERSFALYCSVYDKIKTTMTQSVFLSIYGVFVALLVIVPISSAIFCTCNLVICVTNIVGFVHFSVRCLSDNGL